MRVNDGIYDEENVVGVEIRGEVVRRGGGNSFISLLIRHLRLHKKSRKEWFVVSVNHMTEAFGGLN